MEALILDIICQVSITTRFWLEEEVIVLIKVQSDRILMGVDLSDFALHLQGLALCLDTIKLVR